MMSRKKITYILIILSAILLIVNISNLNFKNLSENNYLGIVSNVLLILAMIFTARDINKDEKK
jgi:ABC-type phosphate transport system substrate-binding protein